MLQSQLTSVLHHSLFVTLPEGSDGVCLKFYAKKYKN